MAQPAQPHMITNSLTTFRSIRRVRRLSDNETIGNTVQIMWNNIGLVYFPQDIVLQDSLSFIVLGEAQRGTEPDPNIYRVDVVIKKAWIHLFHNIAYQAEKNNQQEESGLRRADSHAKFDGQHGLLVFAPYVDGASISTILL